jgi:hypothetical protein
MTSHQNSNKKWYHVEDREVPYLELRKGCHISKDNYVVIEAKKKIHGITSFRVHLLILNFMLLFLVMILKSMNILF